MISIDELRALSAAREQMQGQIQQLTEQVATLKADQEEMLRLLRTVLTGTRRVVHGKNGPEAVELLDESGQPLTSQKVVRDAQGRMLGTQ